MLGLCVYNLIANRRFFSFQWVLRSARELEWTSVNYCLLSLPLIIIINTKKVQKKPNMKKSKCIPLPHTSFWRGIQWWHQKCSISNILLSTRALNEHFWCFLVFFQLFWPLIDYNWVYVDYFLQNNSGFIKSFENFSL